MHIYRAYNLCIQSEIELKGITTTSGDPDVSVSLGNLSHIDSDTLDFGNRVLGNLPDRGRFLVQNGREIIVDPLVGVEESCLAPSVLGSAMSIILRQRGLLALHASCVAINGGAIAFLGGSGWGKSTLAKAFHHEGHNVLTDDVMAVQFEQDCPSVIPSFPQFKLSPEATNFFDLKPSMVSPLFPNAPKLLCQVTDSFQQTPLPLLQIYVLAKGQEHEIQQLSYQESFVELVRHTRGIALMKAPEFSKKHLYQCSRLIETVPTYRLTRKPCLDDISKTVTLIKQNLENSRIETANLNTFVRSDLNAIAVP